jgi:hypothetical protein
MNTADPSIALPTEPAAPSFRAELLTWVRIVTIAGVVTGFVIIGVGSRLAMLLLRSTSDDSVRGRLSDDGFVIGRFDYSDTYGLVQLGVGVGMIGATTYLLLRRWLIGPQWFHAVTIGLASGAVGGSILLHADGVDFRVLGPRWLAISLFIALPAVFGAAIGPTVEAVEAAERRRPGRWAFFVVALALGPAALLSYILVMPVLLVYSGVRVSPPLPRPLPVAVVLLARAFWLGIAVLGLFALIADIQEILDLPPPA